MLAPSNVWLNFSSCIVSGASGVKVPPAIKGSPFFRYCGSRIVDGRSRRNVKRSVAKNAHTCCPGFLARIIMKDRARRSRYNASFPRVQRKASKYFRVRSLYSATLLHINGGAASCAIATWSVYVVLQKSFDSGRRSSIEFHEMKPPLHASLRPFRKATIGRIRGVARRDAA